MSTPIGDLPRRVIPRWRDFRTTAALGELGASKGARAETTSQPPDFEDLLRIWRHQKSDSLAAELLGASWLQNASDVTSETARFIVREGSSAHPFSKEIARHLLEEQTDPTSADTVRIQRNADGTLIRALRHSLRTFPQNAVGWCELARFT